MAVRKKSLAELRRTYARSLLDEKNVARDPIVQFTRWLDEALHVETVEANAMTLATVDAKGSPNARIVLLKGLEEGAFLFFTNYESDKGRELAAKNRAALVFHWPTLERQVRIRGRVKRATRAVSEAYFATRPRESQLGAVASPQSRVVPSRATLERNFARVVKAFSNAPVPIPAHWGGFVVVPDAIEFWQGRPSRLHDRVRFRLVKGRWVRERLAP